MMLAMLPLLLVSQKMLTIEDASGMNKALRPSTLQNLQWRSNSDYFTYIDKNALVSGKASSLARDTILRVSEINVQLEKDGREKLKQFPTMKWLDKDHFWFYAGKRLYTYEVKNARIKEINSYPEEAENIDIHEKQLSIAYTIKNNLFIITEGRQIQVTDDENPGIVNGQSVHRHEFNIEKGTFWSPSGNYLAYYRKDETKVTDYPLVNIDSRIAEVKNIKYPMAGMTSEEVQLIIYDIAKGTRTAILTGEPVDQYLTCISWDPSEKYIYIAVLNRDQNYLKLNQYETESGMFVQTLFEEKDEKYVEPDEPLYFLHSRPDEFIWTSQRDGFRHLYLYNTSGQLIKQLTSGKWVVTDLFGTDDRDARVFFTGTKESPLNQDLYSADMQSGSLRRLSVQPGTHSAFIHPEGKFLIDIFSDTLISSEYAVITGQRKVIQILLRSNDPLEDYLLGKMSFFKIKSSDSTDLWCRMILPTGFDPAKKYPVIVYVYGGPHAQLITNSWLGGAGLFLNYMAQKGYIVFTLDNRGSANRGRDFEQAIFRNLGTIEVEDQMAGVDYLKSLPYADADRIGVNGWSYGGFMTISLMLKEPDVFKVGVCGGPVTDWKFYEVMYGERYMDTPESNPEGYENASLLKIAGNLKGNLLMIQGTEDDVVVWQQTLALLKRFIEEGKLVDYFVYPGHGHGVGGKDRLHLNRKIAQYFDDHL